jgi:CRP-like cAMP-binding protein
MIVSGQEAERRAQAEQQFGARGWLSAQPEAFRARVLGVAHWREVAPGDALFQQGDPPGGVFGVVSGGVAVYAQVGALLPRMGTIIRAGGWFGTASLATGLPRYISTRVQEPSELVQLPLAAIQAMLAEDPACARQFAALAEYNAWLSVALACELALPAAERRIAAVLLRATGAAHGLQPGHPEGFALTQAEIGEMANVSRLHTHRILARMAERGWIAVGYGRLRVLEAAALGRVVAGEG